MPVAVNIILIIPNALLCEALHAPRSPAEHERLARSPAPASAHGRVSTIHAYTEKHRRGHMRTCLKPGAATKGYIYIITHEQAEHTQETHTYAETEPRTCEVYQRPGTCTYLHMHMLSFNLHAQEKMSSTVPIAAFSFRPFFLFFSLLFSHSSSFVFLISRTDK